jgi:UDP-glucose 4-epimerase
MNSRSVLITGAAGYLGSQLLAALASSQAAVGRIVAVDVRNVAADRRLPAVEYCQVDVRSAGLAELFKNRAPEVVVHLASIVTPSKNSNREFDYSVDVLGTENVLKACLAAEVRKIIVTSSGAAYGYHPDNPVGIAEDWPVRGNEAFAYAHHKRLVETMLARWRTEHPQLKQVVLRIGTILGETVHNQITDLFEKPCLIAIQGSTSPFVFIWDQDVVGSILHAISTDKIGIYNVAGDGALTIREIASRLGKTCVVLPAWLLKPALAVLKALRLTQYGPEQVDFLRYRPVLDNRKLKEEFGYRPRKTSSEVFDFWRAKRDTRDRESAKYRR